ncbi:MAG TPA: CDP-alcohol phosphatidyltransferase family protein [Candidatus Hydrothermia bacterium]|nr:CDP-alcohol phosphatidyltransferase family protein [Candidatus Hydrothermae bacterium]MDD3649042.1 CDP-alcohol phosphatidyltransferase family protein [Candidatus Hydrothermia bacterium]HOK22981.1 CDP-alcohol phosphatidyltransferase family protein [Candidatus Hydrothermia bacterium]HOP32175.1 CDP-alcohol phosphatidyltransferase family protein [Candidatus Hydrothermia bacterium]HPO78764.1 CDP-alcohol phosphatidyltransferase family protein [Candidatus Hydrothermia bacterium]
MSESVKNFGRKILAPFVNVFIKLKITPNMVTIAGFLITLIASYLFAKGLFRWAGVIMALGGLCDAVDGEVARKGNRVSKFGAFFDSTIDRFEEFLIFGGILYYYCFRAKDPGLSLVMYFILLGAIMTSYIRARAEGIGYSPVAGPMDRSHRYIFLVVVSLIGGKVFHYSMYVLLILVYITVINRFREFYILINREEKHG